MDAALGWIGQLVDWLLQLLPRITWVPVTHGAVTITRGRKVRSYGPGIVGRWWRPLWWPAWTEVHTYPTVRQTHNTPSQTLTTLDCKSVSVSGVIVYRIPDLEKALTSQWDLEDTINDISQAAMRSFVCSRSFDELRTEDGAELKAAIQKPLSRYGVGVSEAWITSLAVTKVITLVRSDQMELVDE
jgi:regulator of protease activity HflC (stomatin/prohibitin superfamily)